MSWEYARTGLECHACRQPVAEGDLVRRGDVATSSIWCANCAKVRLKEEPPTDVPYRLAAPSKLTIPASFARFSRKDTGQQLRENILTWRRDGKAAAQGGDA